MITGVQGGQVVKAIPIVGINPCGTRREDLLIEPPMLPEIWIQRSLLHRMDEIAAMQFLLTGVPLDLDAVENALDRA